MGLAEFAPRALRTSGFFRQLNRKRRIRQMRAQISSTDPIRVVIGAGPTRFSGWFQTDKEILDVTKPSDWSELFAPDSIDFLLSEHMLEHLTEQQAHVALSECYRYLKPTGLFRIAVPDGNRRDEVYLREASPPKDGHQVLYNVGTLSAALQNVGFVTKPLEYFDKHEEFQSVPWDESEGLIQRSVRFDSQQEFQRGNLFYTSVIIDARKS
ncbi:MAG TPA: methyltransferase domain-containing protein [Pyrinomonadaceae bacterium]|nr:methyltransferase domain-containing protein [Pyrinomonadaceae bacterium]